MDIVQVIHTLVAGPSEPTLGANIFLAAKNENTKSGCGCLSVFSIWRETEEYCPRY
jgi:hypothetical protein